MGIRFTHANLSACCLGLYVLVMWLGAISLCLHSRVSRPQGSVKCRRCVGPRREIERERERDARARAHTHTHNHTTKDQQVQPCVCRCLHDEIKK